jgi:hypothetical protein
LFQIEILYNGCWLFAEAENNQIVAFRVARAYRETQKLPARVTCAGVVLAERAL